MAFDPAAERASGTMMEALVQSLTGASQYNPDDVARPAAILWTDHDAQWKGVIPQLRQMLPELLTLGEYQPDERIGPVIWLRTQIDQALPTETIPGDATPILYLPGVSRQQLRAVEECPDALKPLVMLQYLGVCWTQKNGKDWTVEAFLVAKEGGLGLDVAQDASTRKAMFGALEKLAMTQLSELMRKRLEAEDFDRLLSDDPEKDLLLWLNDPQAKESEWRGERWNAFMSRCRAEFGFEPDKDGVLIGAERLGGGKESWQKVWQRFAEAPALYPGVPDLLRQVRLDDLFAGPSSWPQKNEEEEEALRLELSKLKELNPAEARARVLELEKSHGPRRDWVWAKLGQAPLAYALKCLADLAEGTAFALGGASTTEMAKLYADTAWQVDWAALSAMAAVKSSADFKAVARVLHAIYRPWLTVATERLQQLVEQEPLPRQDEQAAEDLLVEPGGLVFFADGLRLDVSRRLVEQMQREKGWSATLSTRWAALPTVTATAKPAVSPVAEDITGLSLGKNFLPVTVQGEQPLTTDRFRKLLAAKGYQYLKVNETGDPSGRGWTEIGELDKLGHQLKGKLASQVQAQLDLFQERIGDLFNAGWREIRVVTDHGWLWLPGGLPKVDLPKYLTESRWARCAAIRDAAKVAVPTVAWHWNPRERAAVAPGIACFIKGNKYAHGGLSLQESLIPVIRVTQGAATGKANARILDVSWAGLRCRVQIESPMPGLIVQLRTQVQDASSSVSEQRPVNETGGASLLVTEDEWEGKLAVLVVLDASGLVVAKQSTIIGGDD